MPLSTAWHPRCHGERRHKAAYIVVILSSFSLFERGRRRKTAEIAEARANPALNRGPNKKHDADRGYDEAAQYFPILLDRTEVDARKPLAPK